MMERETQFVRRSEMLTAGCFGLIVSALWLIVSILLSMELNKSHDIMDEQDIIKFHDIYSSQKVKTESAIASILLYISIPLFLYKVDVTKRYLNAYFFEQAPWAASIYTWLSLVTLFIWCLLMPSMLLCVTLYNWDIDTSGIGFLVQLGLFRIGERLAETEDFTNFIAQLIPWICILLLIYGNLTGGNKRDDFVKLFFPFYNKTGFLCLLIFVVFSFVVLVLPSFAFAQNGFFAADGGVIYLGMYYVVMEPLHSFWMIWVSKNMIKINEVLKKAVKDQFVTV
eukprot:139616_1